MTLLNGASADRISEHFVHYLFNGFQGSRHIRRVAAWVGFVIRGIQRGAGDRWWVGGGSQMRQLWFSYAGRTFKVKYNHALHKGASRMGGIEIVEVLLARGNPEVKTIATIRDLNEAETFYNEAPTIFLGLLNQAAA
jgi:hypothetical protein